MAEPGIQTRGEQPCVAVRIVRPMAGIDIGALAGEHVGALFARVSALGVEMAGAPFVRYQDWGGETAVVELGFPVSGEGAGRLPRLQDVGDGTPGLTTLPGGRVLVAEHRGPYAGLPAAWARAGAGAALHVPAGRALRCTCPLAGRCVARARWPGRSTRGPGVSDPQRPRPRHTLPAGRARAPECPQGGQTPGGQTPGGQTSGRACPSAGPAPPFDSRCVESGSCPTSALANPSSAPTRRPTRPGGVGVARRRRRPSAGCCSASSSRSGARRHPRRSWSTTRARTRRSRPATGR